MRKDYPHFLQLFIVRKTIDYEGFKRGRDLKIGYMAYMTIYVDLKPTIAVYLPIRYPAIPIDFFLRFYII